MFAHSARVAGRFKLRVTAIVNGRSCVSAERDVEVRFPDYATIVSDANVIAQTDTAWANTKAATTAASRREEGFWIRLNTATCRYEFTATVLGPVVGPNQTGSVILGARPADSNANPNPNANATYTVASFHTHTPMTFRTGVRMVGPTSADQQADTSDDVTGVVYDYIDSPAGSGTIPGGHPLNSPAIRYQSGPVRRRTP